MRKGLLILGIIAGGAAITMNSCDKVVFPNVIITELDTNVFPGNFRDYEFPTFEENTNTLRNALIEDYTGHQCAGCPNAAEIAEDIADAHEDRVFTVGIHAGYQGKSSLQETSADYPHDFTTPEGIEMAIEFSTSYGLTSNPKGNVNRIVGSTGNMFTNQGEWSTLTDEVLATDLDVNIQAKSRYFPSTNGVLLHVESEFINQLEGTYNIVVYVIEDEFVSPQKVGTEYESDYEHHHVHRGNLFNETWGRTIASETTAAGTKVQTDFSYTLPDGLTNDDMHFIIFVFDRNSYEIMQVIEHEF